MPRYVMRELKAKTEEAARLEGIKNRVQTIYNAAVQAARFKPETSYNFQLPQVQAVSMADYHRVAISAVSKYGSNAGMTTDPFYIVYPTINKHLPSIFHGSHPPSARRSASSPPTRRCLDRREVF